MRVIHEGFEVKISFKGMAKKTPHKNKTNVIVKLIISYSYVFLSNLAPNIKLSLIILVFTVSNLVMLKYD